MKLLTLPFPLAGAFDEKPEELASKLYLIGTAHFSRESNNEVREVRTLRFYLITTKFPQLIRNVGADAVAVELCSSRTTLLQFNDEQIIEKAQQLDMKTIMETLKRVRLYHFVVLPFSTSDGHRARPTVLYVLVDVGAYNEKTGHGTGR